MTQGTYPPVQPGPGLMSVVYFTSSGTFNKANYPGAQKVRVRVQGAGGGGGGVDACPAGYSAFGDGGGGGGYCEKSYDIEELAAAEPVTVGAAGTGALDNAGNNGGNSSFKNMTAYGGGGGNRRPSSNGNRALSQSTGSRIGGWTAGGDVGIRGSSGHSGVIVLPGSSIGQHGGNGGDSVLGKGGYGHNDSSPYPGDGYGGGGGGAGGYGGSAAAAGADGSPGIVIIEVYSTYRGGQTGELATRQYVDDSIASIPSEITGLRETLVYESTGTFVKANYPWLRMIKVTIQAGGGAGGGAAATTTTSVAAGSGGGGGGCAILWLPVESLDASENVVVGAGAPSSTAGGNGQTGGNSHFGGATIKGLASGGSGGWTVSTGSASTVDFNDGGNGGNATVYGGHNGITMLGTAGQAAIISRAGLNRGCGGNGGASHLGGGARGYESSTAGGAGQWGGKYGGGGSGAGSSVSQTAKVGGGGGAGVVIIELYA